MESVTLGSGPTPWDMSLFPGGMTSVAPVAASVKSTDILSKLFGSPKVRPATFPKKRLPCWSPAIYLSGEKRGNDNVQSITALVYDFDHATSPPSAVADKLDKLNIRYGIHTTWSHRPSEPRYRVVLFLSRPLRPGEYSVGWENGLRAMGYDAGVDRQARNISRHYALPAQREGEEYFSRIRLKGVPLDSDKISSSAAPKVAEHGNVLTKDLTVELDSGEKATVSAIGELGKGKYKCKCPFQTDASAGSAFVRVLKDGRVFMQCTSERHEHAENQWWLQKTKSKGGTTSSRGVEDRMSRLDEVPKELLDYVEVRIAYNALQGVFYRHSEGAWQIANPLRKETLLDHLVGLLPRGCDRSHAVALIDHVLSRQVYGFDCQSSKEPIVQQNEVPMLNLYGWPDLQSRPGTHPRIDTIITTLCGGDTDAIEWLTHWSAALVQGPERRSMVAVLVLSAQQGIGKSLYGRLLAEIIGKGNAAVVSNRALRDNFNSHYVTSLLVLADEVGIDSKSGDVISELKTAITDDRIHCSAPYAARTNITNRMSWWLTSNHPRPFAVERDDRRFTIFSPAKVDQVYRHMLRDCFDPKTSKFEASFYEELQAFAHRLKRVDINWNLVARPYVSGAKKELQEASQGSSEAFIEVLVRVGAAAILADYPPPANYPRVSESVAIQAVPCETLYGSYREWCQRNGLYNTRTESMFRLILKGLPNVTVKRARFGGRTMDVYVGLSAPARSVEQTQVVQFPS